MPENRKEHEGRYLYCVTNSKKEINLGKIGLEENQVYTIASSSRNLCAVVHPCSPEPYESDDEEEVKRWVEAHQNVLDRVMEDQKFSGIIPAGFDTIIQARNGCTARENVKSWLKEESASLMKQLQKVKNKEEYGVQVTYDPDWLEDKLPKNREEINSLQEKIDSKPEGAAYLYREKLEKLLKEKREEKKDRFVSELIDTIETTVGKVKREDNRERPGERKTLLNLSCLVDEGEYEELGTVLEDIDDREGFSVRFTGPWAPFSFTELNNTENEN